MADFPNYDPLWGLSPRVNFEVLRASFGDGYSQRGRQGLNHKSRSFRLKWVLPLSDAQIVSNFLDEHGGDKSFGWTPPDGVYSLYTCSGYGGPKRVAVDGYEITATFNLEYDIL